MYNQLITTLISIIIKHQIHLSWDSVLADTLVFVLRVHK